MLALGFGLWALGFRVRALCGSGRRAAGWALAIGLATAALLASAQAVPRARDVTYDEARPVIDAAGVSAPEAIARLTGTERAAAWPRWVAQRRAALTARLLRGEEDSLVPLLLFGTSRLAGLGKGLGQAIRGFKREVGPRDDHDEETEVRDRK